MIEVVHRSKNVLISHISSLKRMKQLFTLSGLCAVDFLISGLRYSCCGRVNLLRDGKYEVGYILDEKDDKWKVQLGNDRVIIVLRTEMIYDDNQNFVGYKYCDKEKEKSTQKWTVIEYWPVRLTFSDNSVQNWQYMINHCVFKHGKLVHQIYSGN